MVQDEIIYSGREIVKGDAHPGGYVATGGYGGIFGVRMQGPYITNIPTRKHTWKSDVRSTALPAKVDGLLRENGAFVRALGSSAAHRLNFAFDSNRSEVGNDDRHERSRVLHRHCRLFRCMCDR
jgi:hypothetical protein